MKLKHGYALRELAGEWIAIPTGDTMLETKNIFTLNETGVFIWDRLIKGITINDLVKELTDEYEVDTDQARSDILDIVSILEKNSMMEY